MTCANGDKYEGDWKEEKMRKMETSMRGIAISALSMWSLVVVRSMSKTDTNLQRECRFEQVECDGRVEIPTKRGNSSDSISRLSEENFLEIYDESSKKVTLKNRRNMESLQDKVVSLEAEKTRLLNELQDTKKDAELKEEILMKSKKILCLVVKTFISFHGKQQRKLNYGNAFD
jgi:hypothetical protein